MKANIIHAKEKWIMWHNEHRQAELYLGKLTFDEELKRSCALTQRWFTSPNVECYNVGCHPILHLQHWVTFFNVKIGFFHPTLMPMLGLTFNSKVFFVKLFFFHPMLCPSTLGCEKMACLRSTLGFFTQCCPNQCWVVKKWHV